MDKLITSSKDLMLDETIEYFEADRIAREAGAGV